MLARLLGKRFAEMAKKIFPQMMAKA